MYIFDAWRKWSCGIVCVWPRTNSDTIGLQSAFCTTDIRGTNTVYFLLLLFAQPTIYHKIPVCKLIRDFRSFPR